MSMHMSKKKLKLVACEAILDVLTNGPSATVDEMKEEALDILANEFWDDDVNDPTEFYDQLENTVEHVLYTSVHKYALALNKKRKRARKQQ